MKVLFLSQFNIKFEDNSWASDLASALVRAGHKVSIVCLAENGPKIQAKIENDCKIVRIGVQSLSNASAIKKFFSFKSINSKIKKYVNLYFGHETFDLILHFTAPIITADAVVFCKKKFGCNSYLIARDFYPQMEVDFYNLKESMLTKIIHAHFRKQEKKLFASANKIGCLSKDAMEYLALNNPEINKEKFEIFPDAKLICPAKKFSAKNKLMQLGIDPKKLVFVYAGKFEKIYGIDFLIKCIKACEKIKEAHFLIAGNGSLEEQIFDQLIGLKNVTLEHASDNEFSSFSAMGDIGLIFVDKKLSMPFRPHEILTYMSLEKPILSCVNSRSDVDDLIAEAECGKWCFGGNVDDFVRELRWFLGNASKLKKLGKNGKVYFEKHFNINTCVSALENSIQKEK